MFAAVFAAVSASAFVATSAVAQEKKAETKQAAPKKEAKKAAPKKEAKKAAPKTDAKKAAPAKEPAKK
jgi:adenylate kinase